MEQFRPFPPPDLIDQAEEEEAIRLAPAVELKEWVLKNFLTLGGQLHNPTMIISLSCFMMMKPSWHLLGLHLRQ